MRLSQRASARPRPGTPSPHCEAIEHEHCLQLMEARSWGETEGRQSGSGGEGFLRGGGQTGRQAPAGPTPVPFNLVRMLPRALKERPPSATRRSARPGSPRSGDHHSPSMEDMAVSLVSDGHSHLASELAVKEGMQFSRRLCDRAVLQPGSRRPGS